MLNSVYGECDRPRPLIRPSVVGYPGGMADDKETRAEFGAAVNMTAAELEKWLDTPESKAAGQHDDGGESVGHRSDDHGDAEYGHMRKVIGYVNRHLAQRPEGDVTDTRWRHSLMNWGHDPLSGRKK